MRIDEISTPVAEQSTPTFQVLFRNEDGEETIPTSLKWDLSAMDGTVIALNQSVAVPAATSNITLTAAQTRFLQDETKRAERLLSLYAVYNSDYGLSLIARKQIMFTIEQFTMIGYPISVSVWELILTDDYPRDIGVV